MGGRLPTSEEAAKRLAVAPKTIRDWLREGKLRGVRAGRLWRVRPEELEAFLPAGEGGLSPGEIAEAAAGWKEYLEGKARPWEEVSDVAPWRVLIGAPGRESPEAPATS